MLFVSKKEPLTSENLPDTSLHLDNVRAPCSNSCSYSGSTTFFCPPETCLSKLTREQFDLHKEFLRLGSQLMMENPNLFHQALTLLSAKHNLQVTTPGMSISSAIPQRNGCRSLAKTSDTIAAGNCSVASRASFRKYILPEDVAAKEFYQCMECEERRSSNTFGNSHTHENSPKPNIRWYCPLCDTFYAVTHRGYHLKNSHSDVVKTVQPHSSSMPQNSDTKISPEVKDSVAVKRPRDDSDDDVDDQSALSIPVKKLQVPCCGSPSTVSSASVESSCSHEEAREEVNEDFSFVSHYFPYSQSTETESSSLFLPNEEQVEDQQFAFSSKDDEDKDFFVRAPDSPFLLF